jgi:NADPH:quinone reductase-like Zn-dependent oxidoreductase
VCPIFLRDRAREVGGGRLVAPVSAGTAYYQDQQVLVQARTVSETRRMTDTTTPTLIRTPFGFDSTAAEVIEGIDLSGKRAIVTGGSSGIGIETARALARAGAEVTLAVRNTGAGDRTAADITATTGNTAIHVHRLDLADQASVATLSRTGAGRCICSSTTPA